MRIVYKAIYEYVNAVWQKKFSHGCWLLRESSDQYEDIMQNLIIIFIIIIITT